MDQECLSLGQRCGFANALEDLGRLLSELVAQLVKATQPGDFNKHN